MSDSNFSIGEMRLTVASFLALVLINGIFLGSGVMAETVGEPPQYTGTNQTLIDAGEIPPGPEWTSVTYDPDTEVSFVNKTLAVDICVDECDADQRALLVRDDGASPVEIVDDTPIAVGETVVLQYGDYEIKVTLVSVTDEVTYQYKILSGESGDDGFFSSLPVVGGFLDGASELPKVVGYIASVIAWGVTTLVELVVTIVVTVADMTVFVGGLAWYLISGWVAIGQTLSTANTFLGLLVLGVQIPLYLVAFNGIMKIIKGFPLT